MKTNSATQSKIVLFIDDNEQQIRLIQAYERVFADIVFEYALSIEQALKVIRSNPVSLVLLDNRLHPYDSYSKTLPMLHSAGYEDLVIVISADIESATRVVPPMLNRVRFADKSELRLSSFQRLINENV